MTILLKYTLNLGMSLFCKFSVLTLSLVFIWACNKEKKDEFLFTVQGKVVNSYNGQGVNGVMVHTDYGEPCCGGLAKKLGSDSARTDAQGNYQINLTYPEDTLTYRFITYLKASVMANKFYYYFGEEIQDIGVTGYDYLQMIAPEIPSKLPDRHVHTCHFSILPIGLLRVSFEAQTNPVQDTIILSARRLDKNEVYREAYFYPFNYSGNLEFPVPAGIQTEITQDVIYLGIKKTKKDTLVLNKGQRLNWVIRHQTDQIGCFGFYI